MSSDDGAAKGSAQRVRVKKAAVVRKKENAIKYISLVVLVLQNASQVLVMRYVRTRPREMFLSTVAVLITEVIKLVTCFLIVCAEEMSVIRCFKLMFKQIIMQPIDTLKVCVPATVYVLQNNLLYVAVSNLPAATYMVTYQLKILTTAMFTVIILRRRLSLLQWIALVLLFAGVALVQLDEQKAKEAAALNVALVNGTVSVNGTTSAPIVHKHITEQSPIKGLIAVFVACILSGFAGIYFEKILKGSDVSVWIRNIQLAIISLPVGLANVFVQDSAKVLDRGLLVGFDWVVWGMIMISSLGGLTVAVVIKYADNILKAFATSIAIVVACIASAVFFAFRPTFMFVAGAALVIGAVFIYSLFPYKKRYQPTATEPPIDQHVKESAA
ncbi:unnamed protein product [Toxocara canis]|uniref:UDP-galactose/UDP-N-acetylglucosamine transporter srf-3 n=1 Tax=Toxocara canis TaxID=6265 RepID=A0A183UAE9_TOXCA|nr:unnamed protein product [Toxocara canis]